jgi:chromosome segregation ATPase
LPPLLQGITQEYAEKTVTDDNNVAIAKQRRERRAQRQNVDRKHDLAVEYAVKYRNRGELLMAIENYQNREQQLAAEIQKEKLVVAGLKAQRDSITEALHRVKDDINSIKARLQGMSRKKEQSSSVPQKTGRQEKKRRDTVLSAGSAEQQQSDTKKETVKKPASSPSVPSARDSSAMSPEQTVKPDAADKASVEPAAVTNPPNAPTTGLVDSLQKSDKKRTRF